MTADAHHIKTRLAQGKEVEEGMLTMIKSRSVRRVHPRTKAGAALPYTKRDNRNVNQRIPAVCLGRIGGRKSSAAVFPIQKFQRLYECAHNFRFSHFTLDPANEKSPMPTHFREWSEEATIVNERKSRSTLISQYDVHTPSVQKLDQHRIVCAPAKSLRLKYRKAWNI